MKEKDLPIDLSKHVFYTKKGTCITSDYCDYCIVGDKSPMAAEYELVKNEDGLLISVKKEKTNEEKDLGSVRADL